MRLKNKWLSTFLISGYLGIAIAIILAILGRGNFWQLAINLMTIIGGVPLLSIIAVIAGGLWWWRGWKWTARLMRWSIALVIVAIMQVGSLMLGAIFESIDVTQAKSYCENLTVQLNLYRSRHGKYPKTLVELGNLPALPRLLQKGNFYSAREHRFSFVFDAPSSLIHYWQYDSEEKRWHHLD